MKRGSARRKKALCRSVNTRTFNHNHDVGVDSKTQRNTKKGIGKTMKSVERGLDFTPLFKFLLSKVGKNWDEVYSEAHSRIPYDEPIYWMVFRQGEIFNVEDNGYFRTSETTLYSELFVDENNILQKVNPELKNEDIVPTCSCCTWTFNGKVLNKKFKN